jgi:cytochrome c oxidase subunit 2
MNAVMKAPRLVSYAAGVLALASSAAWAAGNGTDPVRWQLNLIPGVTQTSQNAYHAHMIMLWICVVIGIVVFGAMGYAMYKFRHSKGAVPDTKFTHSTVLEAIWTIIPIVILVGSAIPATRMVIAQYNADHNAAPAEMTVKITGYQWMWRYEYIDQDVNFISRLDRESDRVRQAGGRPDAKLVPHYLRDVDRPLVLPADTRIRFVITADDVIHAWWVPALGWKQDAIPGVINEAWTNVHTPGIYRGVCAELCGKDHGFMPIVVKVVPKAEYNTWLAEQKAANSEAAQTALAPVETAPAATEAPAEAAPGDAGAEAPAAPAIAASAG